MAQFEGRLIRELVPGIRPPDDKPDWQIYWQGYLLGFVTGWERWEWFREVPETVEPKHA